MKVISLGVGRTGTYSLKLALEKLGLGPCHHMEEVLKNPAQISLWLNAAQGRPDWNALYAGYASATDWPTAGFARELIAQYPQARFVLTVRSPESWAESFSQTIDKFMVERANVRPELQPWVDMVSAVLERTGFSGSLDKTALAETFVRRNEAVQALLPSDRLLVYQVKEGWGPLCKYLGVPTPDEAFPRSNDRGEFWDTVRPALLD